MRKEARDGGRSHGRATGEQRATESPWTSAVTVTVITVTREAEPFKSSPPLSPPPFHGCLPATPSDRNTPALFESPSCLLTRELALRAWPSPLSPLLPLPSPLLLHSPSSHAHIHLPRLPVTRALFSPLLHTYATYTPTPTDTY